MPDLDRFSEPRFIEELYRCESCGQKFHYTTLDCDGLCPLCHRDQPPNDEEEDERTENK